MMSAPWTGTLLCLPVFLLLGPTPAHALDKQGSAHGGSVSGNGTRPSLSGAFFFGVAPYNPSYAARPDNSGLTLFRFGSHLDIDLLGRHLSLPVDLNFFTDAQNPDIGKMQPSEFDVIAGVTTTWDAGRGGAIEGGVRIEHDRPIDRTGFTQTNLDVRARYLYSLAAAFPGLGAKLIGGDLSGWLTLGWFAWNPTYAARPDNSGLALLRYGFHTELSLWHDRISVGGDVTMFSDGMVEGAAAVRPSEMDMTVEIIGRYKSTELHVAYERDLPLDRPGLVQSFLYLLAVWTFDIHRTPAPLEARGQIISP